MGLEKRIHKNIFLVVPMYGANLTSVFNFCKAFSQKSSMCLLNFNIQSKLCLAVFPLESHVMCKSPTLSVLGSWLFKSVWHLSVFSFILLFKNQFTRFSPICSKTFITFVISNDKWCLIICITSKIFGI